MADKTTHGWEVLDGDAGVWIREYAFTEGGSANCLVARMPGDKVLVLSPATGLPEGAFADLAELGEVGAVVATNGFHHLGQPDWRRRFPDARFFAPSDAVARIKRRNPKAGDFEPLADLQPLLGEGIIVREVPNTKCGETYAIIKVAGGHVFFVSDILANIEHLPKNLFVRLLFSLTKSAPGFRVFHLGLNFIVKDKRAVLGKLLEDLEAYPPRVVVPAHGRCVAGSDVSTQTRQIVQAAL